jgi:hypothetical protein
MMDEGKRAITQDQADHGPSLPFFHRKGLLNFEEKT